MIANFLNVSAEDEYEETNLATTYPDMVTEMSLVIEAAAKEIVAFSTRGRCTDDECVDNGIWVSGCCNDV